MVALIHFAGRGSKTARMRAIMQQPVGGSVQNEAELIGKRRTAARAIRRGLRLITRISSAAARSECAGAHSETVQDRGRNPQKAAGRAIRRPSSSIRPEIEDLKSWLRIA